MPAADFGLELDTVSNARTDKGAAHAGKDGAGMTVWGNHEALCPVCFSYFG